MVLCQVDVEVKTNEIPMLYAPEMDVQHCLVTIRQCAAMGVFPDLEGCKRLIDVLKKDYERARLRGDLADRLAW